MITPAYAPTATERVLPRMALDFTTASLDSRVTITRALNTATAINSSGFIAVVNANLPRFDYDPVSLACKGLLIEESRANLALNSSNLSAASWSLLRATNTINSGTAPDNTNTANLLLDNAVSGTHVAIQLFTKAASPVAYAASIFLKAGVRTKGEFRMSDQAGNGTRVTFNLSNGTVGTPTVFGTGFTLGSASVVAMKDGWYRIILTTTSNSSVTLGLELYIANDALAISYVGNGSGFYVWGAQLEAGSFATSYIPTTTTSLTRNADRVSMTGTNFSSWYNASEGTIAVQGDTLTVSNAGSMTICSLLLNSSNVTRFWMWSGQPANLRYGVVASGATSADITKAITANTRFNAVGSYKTNLFQYALNAGATTADTSGAVPTGLTAFYIGSLDSVNEPLSGHIAKINFYPQSLTSNEVQAFSK
jgi:hypothetical protein